MYSRIAKIFKYLCIARVYLLDIYIHNIFENNKFPFWGKYFPHPRGDEDLLGFRYPLNAPQQSFLDLLNVTPNISVSSVWLCFVTNALSEIDLMSCLYLRHSCYLSTIISWVEFNGKEGGVKKKNHGRKSIWDIIFSLNFLLSHLIWRKFSLKQTFCCPILLLNHQTVCDEFLKSYIFIYFMCYVNKYFQDMLYIMCVSINFSG